MEYRNIHYKGLNGSESTCSIQRTSIKCPCCRVIMIPQFMYSCGHKDFCLEVFCQCTNSDCGKSFISEYEREGNGYIYSRVLPNADMEKKMFGPIINEISPAFCDIYNQAYAAQQMNLFQICGVGYRKALEFLIKDYILSFMEDEKKDGIKQKNLSKCIQEDISSSNIKAVAARATWIGNDETHYVRKWEAKDIKDLIKMIDLTIHWIESEIETKRLLAEMPI